MRVRGEDRRGVSRGTTDQSSLGPRIFPHPSRPLGRFLVNFTISLFLDGPRTAILDGITVVEEVELDGPRPLIIIR